MPLTLLERGALAIGSALLSYRDPRRGDLIALLGETTAQPYFIYQLRDTMLSDPTGRRILRERPRITSQTLKMDELLAMPDNTLGHAYGMWLKREGVTPDDRLDVRYIDDEECAYVMQRYRECHDFYHALCGLPVFREGEVALKAFEFANLKIPMTGLSVFAATSLKRREWERFWDIYGPWAVRNGIKAKSMINVYWEEEIHMDVDALRERLGIEVPPDLRKIRKEERERRKREKEAKEAMQQVAVG